MPPVVLGEAQAAVLRELYKEVVWLSTSELVDRTYKSPGTLRASLLGLWRQGLVERRALTHGTRASYEWRATRRRVPV